MTDKQPQPVHKCEDCGSQFCDGDGLKIGDRVDRFIEADSMYTTRAIRTICAGCIVSEDSLSI